MLVSGGANGLLISHLIERTDRLATVASRAMTLGVAFVSLVVALIGIGRLTSGWLNGHLEGHQLLICLSVMVLIGLGYFLAARMAPSPATVGSQF
jgi:high-affinity nickel-transport protein